VASDARQTELYSGQTTPERDHAGHQKLGPATKYKLTCTAPLPCTLGLMSLPSLGGARRVRLELVAQVRVRSVALRHDQQAGGALVQPVHDPGPYDGGDRARSRAAGRLDGLQRRRQRSALILVCVVALGEPELGVVAVIPVTWMSCWCSARSPVLDIMRQHGA